MKLVIWGPTEVGKSSLTSHLSDLLSIPKIKSYNAEHKLSFVDFQPTSSNVSLDSYILKGLVDAQIDENNLSNLLSTFDNDVKHLLVYRKNLLAHFLSWHHIEAKYNNEQYNYKFKVDELNVLECKNFIDEIKKSLEITHKTLKGNVQFLCAITYEQLFFEEDSVDIINNFFNTNISKEEWNRIQKTPKNKIHRKLDMTPDMKFVLDNDIEKYNYKENFDILKDMFIDEQLIL